MNLTDRRLQIELQMQLQLDSVNEFVMSMQPMPAQVFFTLKFSALYALQFCRLVSLREGSVSCLSQQQHLPFSGQCRHPLGMDLCIDMCMVSSTIFAPNSQESSA